MARLRVRVTPRASRNAVGTLDADGVLHVRVTTPAAENRANEAVIRLLAEALGVRRSTVRITSGATARIKTIEIDGLDDRAATARLSS